MCDLSVKLSCLTASGHLQDRELCVAEKHLFSLLFSTPLFSSLLSSYYVSLYLPLLFTYLYLAFFPLSFHVFLLSISSSLSPNFYSSLHFFLLSSPLPLLLCSVLSLGAEKFFSHTISLSFFSPAVLFSSSLFSTEGILYLFFSSSFFLYSSSSCSAYVSLSVFSVALSFLLCAQKSLCIAPLSITLSITFFC